MKPFIFGWPAGFETKLLTKTNTLILDIETTLDHNTLWVCLWRIGDAFGFVQTRAELEAVVRDHSPLAICGHNFVGFDQYILDKLWDYRTDKPILDTLVLSTQVHRKRSAHGLDALCRDFFNAGKAEFSDYDGGVTDEMIRYGHQDTLLTQRLLFENLLPLWLKSQCSDLSLWIETETRRIISGQERTGFAFDIQKATTTLASMEDELETITAAMRASYRPETWEEVSEFNPRSSRHIRALCLRRGWGEEGSAWTWIMKQEDASLDSLKRWKKAGKDEKILYEATLRKEHPPFVVAKSEPFNPGSRLQCVSRLQEAGWEPDTFTKTGQPELSEDVLNRLDPEEFHNVKDLIRYFKLSKAAGSIRGWIKAFNPKTGRIHGRVNTSAAATRRMTHFNPNTANIPRKDPELGRLCRELFMATPGTVLVGVDAKALELRGLAHYVQDEELTAAICTGDPHEFNKQKAGLPDRDRAKTFIYGWLYGAGDKKIGSIVLDKGASDIAKERAGAKIKKTYADAVPGIGKLQQKIKKQIALYRSLPTIDGARIPVYEDHAALNYLLQSCGAIIMKAVLIVLEHKLSATDLIADVGFVANVHDEIQMEVTDDPVIIQRTKQLSLDSFLEAGRLLGVRVPIEGDAKHGSNWYETH